MKPQFFFAAFLFFIPFVNSCTDKDKKLTPVVCAVPEWAFRQTELISTEPDSVLYEMFRQAEGGFQSALVASGNITWNGVILDWDVALRNGLNKGNKTSELYADYYIVFKFLPTTSTKEVIIQADLIKSKPYNKDATAQRSFIASATIGETDPENNAPMTSLFTCARLAAKKAAELIIKSGLISKP